MHRSDNHLHNTVYLNDCEPSTELEFEQSAPFAKQPGTYDHLDEFDLQLLEQAEVENSKPRPVIPRRRFPAGQPGIRMVEMERPAMLLPALDDWSGYSSASQRQLPAVEHPELGPNMFLLRPSLLHEEEEFDPYKRPYKLL